MLKTQIQKSNLKIQPPTSIDLNELEKNTYNTIFKKTSSQLFSIDAKNSFVVLYIFSISLKTFKLLVKENK